MFAFFRSLVCASRVHLSEQEKLRFVCLCVDKREKKRSRVCVWRNDSLLLPLRVSLSLLSASKCRLTREPEVARMQIGSNKVVVVVASNVTI